MSGELWRGALGDWRLQLEGGLGCRPLTHRGLPHRLEPLGEKREKGTWGTGTRDGEPLLNALCTQMFCALPGLGSFAEMKLFLALAGLLAPLAVLQTSNGATPGTSAKRKGEWVYWGAPQLSGSLPCAGFLCSGAW